MAFDLPAENQLLRSNQILGDADALLGGAAGQTGATGSTSTAALGALGALEPAGVGSIVSDTVTPAPVLDGHGALEPFSDQNGTPAGVHSVTGAALGFGHIGQSGNLVSNLLNAPGGVAGGDTGVVGSLVGQVTDNGAATGLIPDTDRVTGPVEHLLNNAVNNVHRLIENISHSTPLTDTLHGVTHLGNDIGLGTIGKPNLLTDVLHTPGALADGDLTPVEHLPSDVGLIVGGVEGVTSGLASDIPHIEQALADPIGTVTTLVDGVANAPIETRVDNLLGTVQSTVEALADATPLGSTLGGLTGGDGHGPLGAVTSTLGGLTGGDGHGPLGAVTSTLGGLTGGDGHGPLGAVTSTLGGLTGGDGHGPLGAVTSTLGGLTGGDGHGPLGAVTSTLGGLTGGDGHGPLGAVTSTLGGLTGGDTGVVGLLVGQVTDNGAATGLIPDTDRVTGPVEHLLNNAVNNVHRLIENISHSTPLTDTLHGVTHLGNDIGLGTIGKPNLLTDVLHTPGALADGDLTPVEHLPSDVGLIVGGVEGVTSGLASDIPHIEQALADPIGTVTTLVDGVANAPIETRVDNLLGTVQSTVEALADATPLGSTLGGLTGGDGHGPLGAVTSTLGGLTGGDGHGPLGAVTSTLGGLTGGDGHGPLGAVTSTLGGLTGGDGHGPLGAVTSTLGGLTGGDGHGPLGAVTSTLGGLTGGDGHGPLGAVTSTLGGLTGGDGHGPLGAVTSTLGGLTGGSFHFPAASGGGDALSGLASSLGAAASHAGAGGAAGVDVAHAVAHADVPAAAAAPHPLEALAHPVAHAA